jgi:hypothetical protein
VEYIPVEWHTKFRERAGESEEVMCVCVCASVIVAWCGSGVVRE